MNLFTEIGQTQSAVDMKIDATWSQLFYGNDSGQRVYYPVEPDMAYILDTGNNDVRSEGMSYGMMICVQLNQQTEFNRLWKWAKTNMQHVSGDRQGYFAWQCSTNGNIMNHNPAPDGEEYFAMALYFAWQRWGNGTGIYDYKAEADHICYRMLHQGENAETHSRVTSMFNADGKMDVICFVPYGDAATFTDPSYHIPAFYELFALWADRDNGRWKHIAERSRSFLHTTIHPRTGLGPDYANYDGSPYESGGHKHFEYDAWRTTMNIAVDHYWWGSNPRAVTQANLIQNFFGTIGVSTHGSRYTLSGSERESDHSPGLVAMNACASLISTNSYRIAFIRELWDTAVPSGQYRYYDGLLYFLGLLHCSGQFRMNWGSDTPPS
ncbi:MAG: xylanase [Spirochaetales bacterium]|nr:xylanase [Spirochaetales bacterium]